MDKETEEYAVALFNRRFRERCEEAITKSLIEPQCCRTPKLTTLLTLDGRRRAYCHTCKRLVPSDHKQRITRPCPMCSEPHSIDTHDFDYRFLCKCGYLIEFRQEGEYIVLDYPKEWIGFIHPRLKARDIA